MFETRDSFFIGGGWARPQGAETITIINPSTEETIGRVPEGTEADVDAAVAAARRSFEDPNGWGGYSPQQRGYALNRLADELDARQGDIAAAVSSQNGMPISVSSQLETNYPSAVLRYYAGLAASSEPDERRVGFLGAGDTVIQRSPIGVVAAIVPWNFPQALTAWKIGPALAAGCTMVLKPSPETVLDAYLLADAISAAGIPAGTVNIVPAGREVGAYLVAHPGVDKVTFTGSTAAGRAIGETCGRLLRPVTLELGGKSAALFLDDVDLDLSVIGEALYSALLLNNGQTCFLNSRILAPRSRYDEVVEAISTLAGSMVIGDALDPATQIGPMSTAAHRDRVEGFIAKGRAEGARVVVGGGRPAGQPRGWFVEPTVFAGVDNAATIAQEEIFGPVLSVITYDNDDDAVRIANESDYGLGGSVWTADSGRGQAIARRVRTGTIGVNRYLPDMAAPFGGVKASGLGRELGPEALAAHQELKSIYV
ncbi:aldehyde dehydrogenase [Arthrobacter sp. MI7-26]|uniref:aldehyde dehydrogenase n=1 Tax=Arthrobacter sp. MI7-26 TaxID=2993653 RepID=UPI002248AE30|nr:aldehyde dehydrogenase [Arthrobacter sp. MI7-26]MCX2748040.1 aldehyde dehydrogenase [Arthrobacter sp. MI7-26]